MTDKAKPRSTSKTTGSSTLKRTARRQTRTHRGVIDGFVPDTTGRVVKASPVPPRLGEDWITSAIDTVIAKRES